MPNIPNSIPPDDMLPTTNAELPQTDPNQAPVSSPSEGGPAVSTDNTQTDSEMKVSARKPVSPTQILNLSRNTRSTMKTDPAQQASANSNRTIPIPNMDILSIDDELGVQTEFEKAKDK